MTSWRCVTLTVSRCRCVWVRPALLQPSLSVCVCVSWCVCGAENRRPGHRGVLRPYLRHLQELRVGIHPLLPVQGLTRAHGRRRLNGILLVALFCFVFLNNLIPVISILCCSCLHVPILLSPPSCLCRSVRLSFCFLLLFVTCIWTAL